jgi:hypothetical protein
MKNNVPPASMHVAVGGPVTAMATLIGWAGLINQAQHR